MNRIYVMPPGAARHAKVFRAMIVLATIFAALGPGACSPIVRGDANAVLIDDAPWANADRVAATHCAPRTATFVQNLPGSEYRPPRLLYRCD
jgi:hypothetical protein